MQSEHLKKTMLLILALLLVAISGYSLYKHFQVEEPLPPEPEVAPVVERVVKTTPEKTIIGNSVEGRNISVQSFGSGATRLLFVGGMHGGYEWNSSLLAYQLIEHLTRNPGLIPSALTIDIIPALNPDGLATVIPADGQFTVDEILDPAVRNAAGRFNANKVDLNRNFDCKWAPKSTWRGEEVSAGTAAFSEPEARALRDHVFATNPQAVIFWHSKANNVYASECENGILPETLALMSTYAKAADYGEVPVFDAYPITGDAEGWLASINIPAVTVELESHDSIEWERNLAGIKAIFERYATK